MRQKLITLAVGVLVASVMALPATAGPGKRQGPKKPIPAACLQAAKDTAKTFHQGRRDEIKAWRSANPSATADDRAAFRKTLRGEMKTFKVQQRHDLRLCVANS